MILLSVSFGIGLTAYAQQPRTAELRGRVLDTAGANLEAATVALLRLPDSAVLRQVRTGRDGYRLLTVPGNYLIRATGIGLAPAFTAVTVARADTALTLSPLVMAPAPLELVEVLVEARIPPVTVRGDTVSYHAPAYRTRPNATVEELLKLLPGVQLDASGNLTLQGQRITKVYVDGKEFAIDDPAMLTKTFRADMIAKVEAFNRKSDRERMTGIRDTGEPETAIDLKLKPDRRRGVFGQAMAGGGTRDAQNASVALNGMDGERFAQTVGTFDRNGQVGSRNLNGSVMLRGKWGKVTPALNYAAGGNRSDVRNESERETFLADSTAYQANSGGIASTGGSHKLSVSLEAQPDTNTHLRYAPALSIGTSGNIAQRQSTGDVERGGRRYTANRNTNSTTDDGRDLSISQSLSLNRRIGHRGRHLSVQLGHSHADRTGSGDQRSELRLFGADGRLLREETIDQRYTQTGGNTTVNAGANWVEPLGSHDRIDLGYSFSKSTGRTDRRSLAYNPATGQYDTPDARTSNDFGSRQLDQRVEAGYNGGSGALNYQFGLGAQHSALENENRTQDTYITQRTLNWFPRATLIWGHGRGRSVQLAYNGSSQQPGVEMLQPLADLSNPLLLRLGNPGLVPQFTHGLTAIYRLVDAASGRSLMAAFNSSFTQRQLVQGTRMLDGGVQELRYANADGAQRQSLSITLGLPLGKPGQPVGGLNLTTMAGTEGDPTLVDGLQSQRSGLNLSQQAQLNYRGIENLFADLTAAIDYRRSAYSLQQGLNTAVLNHRYGLNASYQLPLAFTLSANWNLTVNGAQGRIPGRTVNLLNLTVQNNFLKDGTGEVRITANDVFNGNTGFVQHIGGNYIETTTAQVPTRYFLLSLVYHVKALG